MFKLVQACKLELTVSGLSLGKASQNNIGILSTIILKFKSGTSSSNYIYFAAELLSSRHIFYDIVQNNSEGNSVIIVYTDL